MALGSVLVDRARAVARAAASAPVEGTTQMAPVTSEWFRARLFLTGAPASWSQGKFRATPGPQLLYALRDLSGADIVLHFDQKVQVTSRELGNAIWQLTQEPEPIRKRRSLIGYIVNLQRVQEREFEELLVP